MVGALKALLKSRKFLVVIASLLATVGAALGLPADVAQLVAAAIVVLGGVLVGAIAYEDAAKVVGGIEREVGKRGK